MNKYNIQGRHVNGDRVKDRNDTRGMITTSRPRRENENNINVLLRNKLTGRGTFEK